MTDKIKIFAAALFMFGVFAIGFTLIGVMLGYGHGCPQFPEITADTVAAIDSTVLGGTEARPDADSLMFVDSVPYPVPVPVYLPGDTVHDTIYVYLPVEHRHFGITDTLDVWYSGIDPRIDSIRVYLHTTVVTNTVEHEVFKMRRFTANLGAGAMYCDKAVIPYLLGEMRYNAPKTTFAAFGAIDHTGRWGAGLNVTYRINLIK